MPIILDNLEKDLDNAAQQAVAVKTYSPKFFDSKLTGKGGSAPGLLSVRNNPPAVPTATMSEKHPLHTTELQPYTVFR